MHLGSPPPPPAPPPSNFTNHCFQFFLGVTVVPREIKDNAAFWGVSKVHYGLCENNEYLLYILLKSYMAHEHVHYIVVFVCLKGCYRYIKKIFQQLEVTTVYFCLFLEYFVTHFLCICFGFAFPRQKRGEGNLPTRFLPSKRFIREVNRIFFFSTKPLVTIDLVTVLDAILTSRQTREKLKTVFVWESNVE